MFEKKILALEKKKEITEHDIIFKLSIFHNININFFSSTNYITNTKFEDSINIVISQDNKIFSCYNNVNTEIILRDNIGDKRLCIINGVGDLNKNEDTIRDPDSFFKCIIKLNEGLIKNDSYDKLKTFCMRNLVGKINNCKKNNKESI